MNQHFSVRDVTSFSTYYMCDDKENEQISIYTKAGAA